MAKYKVGDKVRIVSERPSSPAFTDTMCKYLGKVMTIDETGFFGNSGLYKMKEDKGQPENFTTRLLFGDMGDGCVWNEKWISGLAEEPKEPQEIPSEPISVHIRFCGPLTVAELVKDGKVVKAANARCNPKDTYDRGEGAKMAVNRLFEKKQKAVEEPAKAATEWHPGDKAVVVRQNGSPHNSFPISSIVDVRLVDRRDNTCLCENRRCMNWVRMDCLEPYKELKK